MKKRLFIVLAVLALSVCLLPMVVGAEEAPETTCEHINAYEMTDGYPSKCDSTGKTNSVYCPDCQTTIKAQTTTPKLGHKYNGKQVVKSVAECKVTGVRGQINTYCSNPGCGSAKPTYEEPGDCFGVEQNDGYPETCTENGLTNSWKCKWCNTVLKQQEVIDNIKTHNYNGKQVVKSVAECKVTGVRGQINTYCSNPGCGSAKPTYEEPGDCFGVEQNDGYPETCTENGLTNSWKCKWCDTVLKQQEVIDNIKTHNYNGKKVVKSVAECKVTGVRGQINTYCSNPGCGSAKPTYEEPGDCVGVEQNDGYAATCTKNGLTNSWKCKWCNTVLKQQEVIKALDHKWDSGKVTKESSSSATGTILYTCLNDATHTYELVTPKLKVSVDPNLDRVPRTGNAFIEYLYALIAG